MNRAPISAIVLTQDEERNIGDCVSSLEWADEVIVVDSGSTDDTIEKARSARADISFFSHPFEDFGQQRNWALDNTSPRHAWILFMDADERSTPAFAAAIRAAVSEPAGHVGYFVCYRNVFLGRWIRHCTLFPSWQLRLLRRGAVTFRKEGHGQREIANGLLGYIPAPFDHLTDSKGLAHWIERHNRYSTHEVELILRLRREPLRAYEALSRQPVMRRRFLKRLAARLPLRPLLRFLYVYVLRLGFLDGRAGFLYCLLRTAHEIHIVAKLAEARLRGATIESA